MADYSINAVTRRVVYTGSAGVGPYAFSFEVLAQTDIAVYKNATKLTLTTHYTVTINANGTGSVTLVSAATGTDKITIIGSRAIERTTDFVTAGDLLASSLNEQLDSQIVMIQQLAEENRRSLKAPAYDPAATEDGGTLNMTLPSAVSRAGNVLGFDSSGNPIATDSIGEWKGNWAAATSFAVRDIVKDSSNSNVYLCITAHTSTGTTPISSNAGVENWALVVEAATATASASAAAASAATATSQASNASASAATASTQATNAALSAASATSSATSATSSATSALASYNSFRGQYYGNLSATPSLDPLGNAIGTGDLYFNTTSNVMFVYSGSAWVAAYASSGGAMLGTNNLSDLASVSSARTNLGLGALATATSATVAQGGTGQTTLTANAVLIGNGTGAVAAIAPSTAGNVLTSDGTNWNSTAVANTTPVGSINIQPKVNSRILATSGTGSVATLYIVPAFSIPVGTIIAVTGVTPTGYNTSSSAVTVSSTLSFSATGSISGTTLTLSSITGTVSIGQEIFGTGVLGNTYITAGSGSSWTVSTSQTVSSTTITGACGTISYANATTGSLTVIGTISATPSGYLACDGATYTRTSYPTLAAFIGSPAVFANPATIQVFSSAQAYAPVIAAANNVLFVNGTATGVTNNATAVANAVRASTDGGTTWSLYSGWNTVIGGQILYGNSVYVGIVGNSGSQTPLQAFYGSSPSTLTSKAQINAGVAGYFYPQAYGFAFGNSLFMVSGLGTDFCGTPGWYAMATSSNGSTWTAATLPVAGTQYILSGSTAGFLADSNGSNAYFSTNGASWTNINSSFSGTGFYGSGANGLFIVSTSSGFYLSSNGTSWTLMPTPRGITVPINYQSTIGRRWTWTGSVYVSNTGYITSDFVNFSVLAAGNQVANYTGGYPQVANGSPTYLSPSIPTTTVIQATANNYTASTQFVVPNLVSAFAGTNQAMGGIAEGAYYIKT